MLKLTAVDVPNGVVTLIVTESPGAQSLNPKLVNVASSVLRTFTELSPAIEQLKLFAVVRSMAVAETMLPVGTLLLLFKLLSLMASAIPPVVTEPAI